MMNIMKINFQSKKKAFLLLELFTHQKKPGFFKEVMVVQKLEVWYGVEIVLEGNTGKVKSQDWTYMGMFKNENLENVLSGISYVKDFSFEINGKNIKLMFN